MLTNSLHLSIENLKIILLNDLSVFNVALAYVLIYVVYKSLGRYVYFRPQEHASKINRTFLVLSLLVVGLSLFSKIQTYLPILPEYQWIFVMSILVISLAPLSILIDRIIWKYHKQSSHPSMRSWCYDYLPISRDYFKTSTSKSESHGNVTSSWEEETVKSTGKNLHSDALLNIFALVVFVVTGIRWSYESYFTYGWNTLVFSTVLLIGISLIFTDRGVFSWIKFLERGR